MNPSIRILCRIYTISETEKVIILNHSIIVPNFVYISHFNVKAKETNRIAIELAVLFTNTFTVTSR